MKIGIVNDTVMAAEGLRRIVTQDGDHEVLWVARDGEEAVRLCAADLPELILMDLIMPIMDGVEATRRIMNQTPCPILVVTASVSGNVGQVFEAMGAGALDAINTPLLDGHYEAGEVHALLSKIDIVGRLGQDNRPRVALTPPCRPDADTALPYVIVIGASSGGPQALATVLGDLPGDLAAAVVVIQHVDHLFAPRLAEWLNEQVALPVLAAAEGDILQAGTVRLAVTADHLVLRADQTLGYVSTPEGLAYRPSIDVFFDSVACHWQGPACGVLLTGMGRDGAVGLRALRDNRAFTIAQDQQTSRVYGMPRAAREIGAADAILPLQDIAPAILENMRATRTISADAQLRSQA